MLLACSINACNASTLSLFKRDLNLWKPSSAIPCRWRALLLYLCLQVAKRSLIRLDEAECCALISCFGGTRGYGFKKK